MRIGHYQLSKRVERQFIEKLTLVVAIVEPIITLPQVIEIFSHKSAKDISLLSWVFWLATSTIWLTYAKMRKDLVLIVSSALWVLFDGLMVLGIILYG